MNFRSSFLRMYQLFGVIGVGYCLANATLDAAAVTYHSSPSMIIPDGDSAGAVFSIEASGIGAVTDVNLTLNLTGSDGFNGDYYAYLTHEETTEIAILLNRPGKDEDNIVGTFGSGFSNLTFDDAGADDIHTYKATLGGSFVAGSALSGTWQPDGRAVDPDEVSTSSSRTGLLSALNGIDGEGEWTLFIADISEGGTLTLNDWSLELSTVPEPGEYAALVGLGLLSFCLCRRVKLNRTAISR